MAKTMASVSGVPVDEAGGSTAGSVNAREPGFSDGESIATAEAESVGSAFTTKAAKRAASFDADRSREGKYGGREKSTK